MRKAFIHQSEAEKLANNSASTITAIQQNTTEVIKALKANTPDNSELIEKLIENKQKLDEVKSASLITNQQGKKSNDLLEKIANKSEDVVVSVDTGDAEVVTIKGDKGGKGEKGDKGDTGPRGENGLGGNGRDGVDGQNGLNGKDGVGKDGFNGIDGRDGVDGSPDTPEQVIEKVNKAEGKIEPERVKGLLGIKQELDTVNKQVQSYGSNPQGVGGGKTVRYLQSGTEVSAHVTELNFSTGITATYATNGRITLTGAGFDIAYQNTAPGGPSDGDLWIDTSVRLDLPVTSADISSIVALTQAEYDALTPVATTLYVITP